MAFPNLFNKPATAPAPKQPALEGDVVLPTDTAQPTRIGMWVLGLGFGGFLLWSSLAPLDEGVPTSGIVTLDTKRKTIQHLSGGIVKDLRQGRRVREGRHAAGPHRRRHHPG